jgi:branched-chain amino acid transport system permease protein
VVILGVLIERLVMRPIADSDWLTLFTATLGVYYILHGVAGWLWGRDTKAFPITFDPTPINLFGTVVTQGHLVNMAWATVIGFALFLFFRYTKQGIAMRAVTDDPDTAKMMGIPVRSIVMLTWGMAGFLAAFAGILTAPIIYVAPQMMDQVLIKGYVAAVFGGLYSIPGAVVGSLMIGVAENLAGGYFGSQYKTATAFAMIVALLAIRPQGLFGIQHRREF